MSFLRFLMLLALIVWIGGIIFFAFVHAPTLFSVLPNHQMAGDVVSATLTKLHWMGLISGVVFLIASLLYNWQKYVQLRPFMAINIFVVLMLAFTMVSQFGITPRMREAARRDANHRFLGDRQHSRRIRSPASIVDMAEGGVLILGLGVVGLTARRFGSSN